MSTESSEGAWSRTRAVLLMCSYAAGDAESAVHGDDGAGHEGGGVAAEESNDADELFRPAEASHRRLGDHALRSLGVLPVRSEQNVTVLRGDEEARCDCIDPEPVAVLARQLHRHPAREAVDAGLGHRVPEDAAQLAERRHR